MKFQIKKKFKRINKNYQGFMYCNTSKPAAIAVILYRITGQIQPNSQSLAPVLYSLLQELEY